MRQMAHSAAAAWSLLLLIAVWSRSVAQELMANPPESSATALDTGGPVEAVPSDVVFPPFASSADTTEVTPATHGVVYDDGWILRPLDPYQTPCELKINFHD